MVDIFHACVDSCCLLDSSRYYVVHKAHESAFRELEAPFPRCHACWVESGREVAALYFSKVATSATMSVGALNPCFSVFYADP